MLDDMQTIGDGPVRDSSRDDNSVGGVEDSKSEVEVGIRIEDDAGGVDGLDGTGRVNERSILVNVWRRSQLRRGCCRLALEMVNGGLEFVESPTTVNRIR
jgi:hypothetical protein